jgi:hypothetical protein
MPVVRKRRVLSETTAVSVPSSCTNPMMYAPLRFTMSVPYGNSGPNHLTARSDVR